MNDLVERLRQEQSINDRLHGSGTYGIDGEAADEIERLQAENERLQIWSSDSHVTELVAENERLQAVIRQWPVGAWGWREAQKAIGEDPEESNP